MRPKLILTCEHADYQVPPFISKSQLHLTHELLKSHRGWDQGALALAKALQLEPSAKLFSFSTTRLLVDANRTVGGLNDLPRLSQACDLKQKQKLLELHRRYREELNQFAQREAKKSRPIFILSVHSFTPVLDGRKRKTDIGLLFRPRIAKELEFAKGLKKNLKRQSFTSNLNIHMNLPYRGFTDCCLNDVLDQYLKHQHVNGLFLEVNQRLLQRPSQIRKLGQAIRSALEESY